MWIGRWARSWEGMHDRAVIDFRWVAIASEPEGGEYVSATDKMRISREMVGQWRQEATHHVSCEWTLGVGVRGEQGNDELRKRM
jgi:hypothetical protein